MLTHFKQPLDFVASAALADDVVANLELEVGLNDTSTPLFEALVPGATCAATAAWRRTCRQHTRDAKALRSVRVLAEQYAGPDTASAADAYAASHAALADDAAFHSKFQYLDTQVLRPLNAWRAVAYVLTISNYGAPVFNLLLPLLSLGIALLALYVRVGSVSLADVRHALWNVVGKRMLGPILDGGTRAAQAYGIMVAAAYVYNVYSHAKGCMRFHAAFATMDTHLANTRALLRTAVSAAEAMGTVAATRPALTEFGAHLATGATRARAALDFLGAKPPSTRMPGLQRSATTLHNFYNIVFDPELVATCTWCCEALGYAELVSGVGQRVRSGALRPAAFTRSRHTAFTGMVHPALRCGVATANDVELSKSLVITGPNASGKTTLIKAVAVNMLLCQQWGLGAFEAGRVRPVAGFSCYMNVPDTNGRDSLFQAEARRCKDVLDDVMATPGGHLCLFDELYSGTNPDEAAAASVAYLSHLQRASPSTRFLLTTHLTCVATGLGNVARCSQMGGTVSDESFTPTYACSAGVSRMRSGFLVLRELGYPAGIVDRLTHSFAGLDNRGGAV